MPRLEGSPVPPRLERLLFNIQSLAAGSGQDSAVHCHSGLSKAIPGRDWATHRYCAPDNPRALAEGDPDLDRHGGLSSP